jgi:membrane-associated phospholipid phosphatase
LLRIAGDMHYLSDVVFGAAVGLGTGWLVAELHEPRQHDSAQIPTSGAAQARDALTPSGMTLGLGRGWHLRAGLVGGGPAFAIQGGF